MALYSIRLNTTARKEDILIAYLIKESLLTINSNLWNQTGESILSILKRFIISQIDSLSASNISSPSTISKTLKIKSKKALKSQSKSQKKI